MFHNPLVKSFAALSVVSTVSASAIYHRAVANCSAAAIPNPSVFGADITSLTATRYTNYQSLPGNDICLVNITLTHPGTGDNVTNWVALPLNGWNGILQGVGGGGYQAGTPESLGAQTALGYSAVSTDSGHSNAAADEQVANSWALVSTGNVNQYALLDFAHRSYHDMTVIGKAVSESFHGCAPRYAYWNGCSTGGRQGMVMAQYYPDDYDGILAEAPAIQWNDFTPEQQWPYTVMNNEGYAPPQCEFDAVHTAVIEACDSLDGQVDGIISAPALCKFTATSLIGQTYTCNGTTRTFTQQTADVIDKIWAGPTTTSDQFLWYGLVKGANFSGVALSQTIDNITTPLPFGISDSWFSGFLAKNLSYPTSNITYAQFPQFFLQGHIEYDSIIGTASPDLSAFSSKGGKLLTWQGLADQIIPPQGTMLYYQKVMALDPDVSDWYRQFYSPGVGHCGGGTGVLPIDALGQLRSWVENGTAPETLAAGSEYPVNASASYPANGTNLRFLDLCPWPAVQKYDGTGDPSVAASYACVNGTGWEMFGASVNGGNFTACEGGRGWY